MAIDRDQTKVAYALQMAKKYYSRDTYDHAMRVMEYVAENDVVPYETDDDCVDRLKELQNGEISVSRRNSIELDIKVA